MHNILQMTGGYPVEPIDVHPSVRHLECVRDLAVLTDKPFHAYSLGKERNVDAIEIARIARGVSREQLLEEPSLFTIINTNSPLKLDVPMMEGIIQMSSMGQIVVVTPFTLSGAMAPVTVAGALVLQNAEALAGIAFTQMVRKGAPVGYGGFTSNVDMKSGAPAFGTPEYMKAQLVGGQLARRYKLPYRTSNTCAANTVDAQAAYESVFSIWGAVQGGGNFMMHGAGWLEGGLRCSYEKMILDIDLLADGGRVPDAARSVGRRACCRGDPRCRPGRTLLRHGSIPRRATATPSTRRCFPTGAILRPGSSPARRRQSKRPTASGKSGWPATRNRTWILPSARSSTPSSKSASPKAARRRIFESIRVDGNTSSQTPPRRRRDWPSGRCSCASARCSACAVAPLPKWRGSRQRLLKQSVRHFSATASLAVVGLATAGRIGTHVSLKNRLLVLLFLTGACLAALFHASNAPALIIGLSAFSFLACGVDLVMNAEAIAVEKDHEKPVLAGFHGMASIGLGVGAISGSYLSVKFGMAATTFAGIGVTLIAAVAVILGTPNRGATHPIAKARPGSSQAATSGGARAYRWGIDRQ